MAATIAFTRTSATAEVLAGTTEVFKHPSYGLVTAAYIKNSSSGDLAQGDLCRIKASQSDPTVVDVSATALLSAQIVLGVADHAIPQNYYGWIITRGVCQIKGDGSVTGGSTLVSDATAGRVKNIPAPANAQAAQDGAIASIGVALADDGSAGSLFSAKLGR